MPAISGLYTPDFCIPHSLPPSFRVCRKTLHISARAKTPRRGSRLERRELQQPMHESPDFIGAKQHKPPEAGCQFEGGMAR